jgi:hypothetical protein
MHSFTEKPRMVDQGSTSHVEGKSRATSVHFAYPDRKEMLGRIVKGVASAVEAAVPQEMRRA